MLLAAAPLEYKPDGDLLSNYEFLTLPLLSQVPVY